MSCYIFHISFIIIHHAMIVSKKKIKNFITLINRLTCILFTKFISNCQCVCKNKKKRPSRPKSTVNTTCDVSKLYLKYTERQENPNYFIIIFFSIEIYIYIFLFENKLSIRVYYEWAISYILFFLKGQQIRICLLMTRSMRSWRSIYSQRIINILMSQQDVRAIWLF